MRQAGAITTVGVTAAADVIRNGGTDADAAGAAFVAMVAGGSDPLADTPYVAAGPRTAMAHALWRHQAPAPGEVVPIYMSASIKRYQCPVERTYVRGQPDARTESMLEASIGAVEAVLADLRPGMTSHEADRIGRHVIEKAGYGEFFVNRLAYSVGIGFPPVWWENEIMQLRPSDDRLVESGMTFHLVPALHVPGIGFVNRSLPIVVTERGCEPLMDLPLRVETL
jgi:Xaa-Pro dipeptidase